MKALFGVLLIVAGIVLGLYLGVWVCFIGGIVDIINQIKSPELDAMVVAFGVAKIVFASFVGWVSAIVFCGVGIALLSD